MSTPTDSVAPAPPTGSSNPWSLVQWWKRICDWIAALSPPGADKYDTGWVDVPPAAGFTSTIQVRRTGSAVQLQGTAAGTFTANVTHTVATVGPDFRTPSGSIFRTVSANNGETGWGWVHPDGTLRMRFTTTGSRTVGAAGLGPYAVD